jgi:ribose transport system substrate-binding protein
MNFRRLSAHLTLLCVFVSLCLCVSACGGGSSPASSASSKKMIGVTLLTAGDAFYKDLEAGLREEAAAKGFELVLVSCEKDPAKQASQIEDFVAKHVAAIVAAPCDSDAIVPALAAPAAANIPVFTVDIAAHGGKVASHVASDNVLGGKLAAEALAGYLNGKGKIIIIDHPTVASVQDRVKGFEEGLKKYPGISIVARPSSDGNRAPAARAMEDMLQAHPDLAGVFAINDDTALGAAGVIEAAKRKDIAIVGYDATDEAQAAIRKGGPLKADVIQYPRKIGTTAIDTIADFLAGKTVAPVTAIDVGIWK